MGALLYLVSLLLGQEVIFGKLCLKPACHGLEPFYFRQNRLLFLVFLLAGFGQLIQFGNLRQLELLGFCQGLPFLPVL